MRALTEITCRSPCQGNQQCVRPDVKTDPVTPRPPRTHLPQLFRHALSLPALKRTPRHLLTPPDATMMRTRFCPPPWTMAHAHTRPLNAVKTVVTRTPPATPVSSSGPRSSAAAGRARSLTQVCVGGIAPHRATRAPNQRSASQIGGKSVQRATTSPAGDGSRARAPRMQCARVPPPSLLLNKSCGGNNMHVVRCARAVP